MSNWKKDGIAGTPKTLKEAVRRALDVGRLSTISDDVTENVRDFLAQRFAVALLKHDEYEECLCELWTAITGESCEQMKGRKR